MSVVEERVELLDIERWIASLPVAAVRTLALGPASEHRCRLCELYERDINAGIESLKDLYEWHLLKQEDASDENAKALSGTRCMVIYLAAKLELKERYPA